MRASPLESWATSSSGSPRRAPPPTQPTVVAPQPPRTIVGATSSPVAKPIPMRTSSREPDMLFCRTLLRPPGHSTTPATSCSEDNLKADRSPAHPTDRERHGEAWLRSRTEAPGLADRAPYPFMSRTCRRITMTWTPSVTFEDTNAASLPNDQDIEKTLAQGVVSNSGLSMYQAMKRPDFGQRVPYAQARLSRRVQALRPHLHARAIEVSDPSLDRSDETAIAINPRHPHNIVAGAASFDGTQFTNTAYVTKDGGRTWKTVVALANTSEGAGIAFDDSNNCYYTTMRGGFFPVCVVSKDGGLTWSQPAAFGFGDKTAVAARGQTALCGFDRINIEACAFTLDGGATWTVHDFTDRGIGTAPLISYDQQHFYIIYAALDQNLKMYASSDQGQTWAGPMTIVAGNASQSAIVGPLSYEGGALTSPGTNVAIDGRGRLHVLYIDSAKQLPMYTTSHD